VTHRAVARVVGVLFLSATVPFSLSVVLLEPVLGASDYLLETARSASRVTTGALFELINHISVVGIAVVIYPVLRPFSERLAVGYVAARSIEAALFAVGTMHLFALVVVSQQFLAAGAPSTSHFQTLGAVLLAGHDWNQSPLAFTAFGVGALMLNYLLYRSRLVPRWLSVAGLIAAVSILVARALLMLRVELSWAAVTVLDGPIMLQEIILAVWLIGRGFNEAALEANA